VELPPPHPVSEMTQTIANAIKEVGLRIKLITSLEVINERLAQSMKVPK
jgi:hypothetical protein